MATNFPTSLDTFVDPAPTNLLDGTSVAGTSHAAQHDNINDAVAALEAKVGVNSSAVTTSLDYIVNHLPSGGSTGVNVYPAVPAFSNIARNTATGTHGVTGGNPSCFGFVAPTSMSVGHVRCFVTAFNASVSDAWIAIYTLAANGDATRIALTATTPSAFNASNGAKTLALTSSVSLTAGTAYAVMLSTISAGPTISASLAVSSVVGTAITQPWLAVLSPATGVAPATSFTFAASTIANLAVGYFEFLT